MAPTTKGATGAKGLPDKASTNTCGDENEPLWNSPEEPDAQVPDVTLWVPPCHSNKTVSPSRAATTDGLNPASLTATRTTPGEGRETAVVACVQLGALGGGPRKSRLGARHDRLVSSPNAALIWGNRHEYADMDTVALGGQRGGAGTGGEQSPQQTDTA